MLIESTGSPGTGEVRPPFDNDCWQRFVRGEVERAIELQRLPRSLYDDFVAQGFLGLAEALARSDTTELDAFSGYARVRVRGAIIDAVRGLGRLSRRGYEAARRLSVASDMSTSAIVDDFVTEAAHYLAGDSGTPEERFIAAERRALLASALDELEPDDQSLIRELYGLDHAELRVVEVAAIRGASRSCVSRHHRRILRQLRKAMEAAHG